jgi:hypothetical protein
MQEVNQNTLDYSKSSKAFINPNGRALQQQVAPMLSREKWDGSKRQRAREMGRNFSRVTLAQRLVKK